jgi:GMP synthase (glutamine-hydrolysing)
MKSFQILIIDLGSQYTLLIGRILRELGFRSIILPPEKVEQWLTQNHPKAIILSGGSASVHDSDCPTPPSIIWGIGARILGICLGMQWIAQVFGGKVTSTILHSKEYGPVFIKNDHSIFFDSIDHRTLVWASHGDVVDQIPTGFKVIAHSEDFHHIAAIANADNSIIGIQFHPEVKDTIEGEGMLKNFVLHAACEPDWDSQDVIAQIREEIREAVTITGTDTTVTAKAILGLSGGVDSSVTAKLLQPIFGEQLRCIVIDSGFFREGEIDEINQTATKHLQVEYVIIDAVERFQAVLGSTTDAEEKRKAFKVVYQQILEEEAEKFGAQFIVQGSLATDFIESGKAGGSALIKSHHNIGISWKLKEIHPLRNLFKYEVRELGRTLRLPDSITHRQPFPGPGLMVRIIGTPATIEMAEILRYGDRVVREVLEDHGIYDQISQLVVAIIGKTVGVKGDGRVYGYNIIVRPVVTKDFMTCSVYELPWKIIHEMTRKVTQHPQITRLWIDPTSKPPGTTEME